MSSSEASQFGINNIPYGIGASQKYSSPQAVTRIFDDVIFLADAAQAGIFHDISVPLWSIFGQPTLNAFAALPRSVHRQVRSAIQSAHSANKLQGHLENLKDVQLHLPVRIGDFTDFSASANHVLNAGEAIMGTRSFPPAFHKYPVGYAGRCSSINLSGTPVRRPLGQYIEDYTASQKNIIFGPCRALDYELEVGAVIGRPWTSKDGEILKAKDADEHIFGLVLVNDWSARDIQGLEMNPLGPFNGKNFATTISPWIITLDALEKYNTPAPPRMNAVADFMDDPEGVNYNIDLEVEIVRHGVSTRTCKVGFQTMYWTFRHMLAHHAVGGCELRTGDLIASGTVSGEGETEHGCLLELTMNGKKVAKLYDDTDLRYLEDGDEVRFKGFAGPEGDGVGFGECCGVVKAASLL